MLDSRVVNPVASRTLSLSPLLGEAVAGFRDLVELTKPRITSMVVLTALMGAWLAPGAFGATRAVILALGTALLVGSANMLNCWLERDVDGLMARTRGRAIPAGRLDAWVGFAAGLGLGAFAVPLLALGLDPLTALLGAIAHATYVWVYTPLKRSTPLALEVGAIPGAIPPLMGWTAATGGLALPGFFLFGILFFWQLPHFLAIAIYLEEDYRRGGLAVLSVRRGSAVASRRLALYAAAAVAWSLLAEPLGLAGRAYTIAAVVLGAAFLALTARGVREPLEGARARRAMLFSIVWLCGVLTALVLAPR